MKPKILFKSSLILFLGIIFIPVHNINAQETTVKLPTNDNTSSFNVTDSNNVNLLKARGDGNIGIGTTNPGAKLEVAGQVKITGGNPGVDKVLTSDASGLATWETVSKHYIGEIYGGGIVFWVDATGQHGLISATSDQHTSMRWYAGTYGFTRSKGNGIGAGEMNTAIIIAAHVAIGDDGSTYAARVCADLVKSNYSDWYLPSEEELKLMNNNLHLAGLGGFASGSGDYYWSSTEYHHEKAVARRFGSSGGVVSFKTAHYRVRAVRAF